MLGLSIDCMTRGYSQEINGKWDDIHFANHRRQFRGRRNSPGSGRQIRAGCGRLRRPGGFAHESRENDSNDSGAAPGVAERQGPGSAQGRRSGGARCARRWSKNRPKTTKTTAKKRSKQDADPAKKKTDDLPPKDDSAQQRTAQAILEEKPEGPGGDATRAVRFLARTGPGPSRPPGTRDGARARGFFRENL